ETASPAPKRKQAHYSPIPKISNPADTWIKTDQKIGKINTSQIYNRSIPRSRRFSTQAHYENNDETDSNKTTAVGISSENRKSKTSRKRHFSYWTRE
ncbi:hypothetical protein Tsubulata_013911, partial [Turnera subulata]